MTRRASGTVRTRRRPFGWQLVRASVLYGWLGTAVAVAAPPFEPEAICRTAIASIMGRDPKLIQITRTDGDILFLSYVRPIDNFVWDYRCRIDGNRVIWAAEPGRWRDGPKDDKVSFEVVGDGKQLQITEDHADGTATRELFDSEKIR